MSENAFDISSCVENQIGEILACSICSRIPRYPYKIDKCNHIACFPCVQNYRLETQSSKCPFEGCMEFYNESQVVPLSGRDRAIHQKLTIICTHNKCNYKTTINSINEHIRTCTKRGYCKVKSGLRGKTSTYEK